MSCRPKRGCFPHDAIVARHIVMDDHADFHRGNPYTVAGRDEKRISREDGRVFRAIGELAEVIGTERGPAADVVQRVVGHEGDRATPGRSDDEEGDLRVGRACGFEQVGVANAVFSFVLARVDLEESLRTGDVLERELDSIARAGERLPRLTTQRSEYERARVDEHFRFGLELMLDGIAARKQQT